MNQRRWISVGILLSVLLALLIVLFPKRGDAQDRSARERLDQLLGQDQPRLQDLMPAVPMLPQLPPQLSPERLAEEPFFKAFPDFQSLIQKLPHAVEVIETPQAYQLKVPVASEAEAEKVQVKVLPHQIEVSGESGQGGMTSHFMQSFTTSQAVDPDRIKRELQGQQLVITIPKKTGGAALEPSTPVPFTPLPEVKPAPLSAPLNERELDRLTPQKPVVI